MLDREVVIRSLRRELQKAPVRILKESSIKIVFLFEPSEDQAASLEERALVERMAEAMKLPEADWLVISRRPLDASERGDVIEKYTPRILVDLSLKGSKDDVQLKWKQESLKSHKFEVLHLYHPSLLMKDPSKKKEVWADLKSALVKLH